MPSGFPVAHQSAVSAHAAPASVLRVKERAENFPVALRVLQVLQAAQRSLVMNGEPLTLPIESIGEKGAVVFS